VDHDEVTVSDNHAGFVREVSRHIGSEFAQPFSRLVFCSFM
jgi:hypothetical protein